MQPTPSIGMNVSMIVLLFIAGVVLAGIVLLVALLANRQTRGVGLALFGGGLLLALLAGFLFIGYSRTEVRYEQARRHAAMSEMMAVQQQVLAQAHEQVAESHQAVQSANPPAAAPPAPRINVEQQPFQTVYEGTVSHDSTPTWFGLLRLMPIVLLVVFALLMARGHRLAVVGALAAVAIAGVLGIFWLRAARPMMSAASSAATPTLSAEAWDFATAPRIAFDETSVESPQPPSDTTITDPASISTSPGPADETAAPPSSEVADEKVADETAAADPDEDLFGGDDESEPAKAAPPAKPAWLDAPPQQVGNVYRRVLSAGPYATHDECHADMRQQIERATLDYVAEQSGLQAADSLAELGVAPGYLLTNCVSDQYYEPRDMSGGYRMWTQYVQLEFDAASTDYLIAQNRAALRGNRVTNVALAGGGVLGTLALVLGLLRLDTATKGYYTKRLFIGVPLAIIGALGLLAFVS